MWDLEFCIGSNVNEYVANEGQKYIVNEIEKWLIVIGREIDVQIRGICFRYGIPEVAFDLGRRSGDVRIALSEIQCADLLDEDVYQGVASAIAAGVCLSMLAMGAPAIAAGPPGWVVFTAAGAIALVVQLLAKNGIIDDELGDTVKSLNIPKMLRWVLHENSLKGRIDEKRSEIQNKISVCFNQELLSPKRFDELLETLRTQLISNADRVSLMIT